MLGLGLELGLGLGSGFVSRLGYIMGRGETRVRVILLLQYILGLRCSRVMKYFG